MARKSKKPVVELDIEHDDEDNSGLVKVEVTATPAPAAPVAPPAAPVVEAPAKTEPKMVPVMRRAPTHDTEKRPSVLELNRQHMEQRKKELAERDEAYMKGIAALQLQFGIAANSPIPQVMAGGHTVVPVASPHAQQLMAQNAAAAAKK